MKITCAICKDSPAKWYVWPEDWPIYTYLCDACLEQAQATGGIERPEIAFEDEKRRDVLPIGQVTRMPATFETKA